jgi:hypothetical protein
MKLKTREAKDKVLNYLVAKCEGIVWEQGDLDAGEYGPGFAPATQWEHGGPIIERERIRLDPRGLWCAAHDTHEWTESTGPTPLIAAMRCYVASKLGDEVEIPEELR